MANSIVMKMRIFNNHQNTNLMAVLVKGQPFSLIDQLTTPPQQGWPPRPTTPPHPKQADQQSLADQQSPPADRRASSWDSHHRRGPAGRTCHPTPTTEGQLKGPAAGNTTLPSAKTNCDHYSTGENNDKQERKHS